MHPVLSLADNLSTALQKKSLSAAEGQRMAADTVRALEKLWSEEEKFWKDVQSELSTWMWKSHNFHVVGELQLDSIPEQLLLISLPLEEVYRPVYYNAVDSIIAGIKDRFDQPRSQQRWQRLCRSKPASNGCIWQVLQKLQESI